MRTIRALSVLLCLIAASVLIGYTPSSLAAQGASGPRDKTAGEYAATLPKDVYPDSGSRLPAIKREDMNKADQELYDEVVDPKRGRSAALMSPLGMRLHNPRLFRDTRQLTGPLRKSVYGPRLAELAILVTARELNQQFEWTAHEDQARKAGLDQNIIDIVKYRKPVTGLGEKEAAIIQLGREAVGKRKVSSDTFARALKLFGKEGLLDLASLMGYYASTAVLLETFDQHLRPDQKPLLPIP